MNLTKLSKTELLAKCEELGITKCKSKNKNEIIQIINNKSKSEPTNFIIEEDLNMTNAHNKIISVPEEIKQNNIKYIDLCCGIGGFRVALNNFQKNNPNYSFDCILSADIKDDAIKTYNLNFNENIKKTNIIHIEEINPFDLLCAGFPCQPFSSAGQKKGFEDDRGGIIFKIVDICKKYKPKFIILENVPNLITLENGKPLKRICDEFKNIGYFVSYKKLNSSDFGIPQNRERVFIVCCLEIQINLEKIVYVDQDVKLNSIMDYEAKYTDIEKSFADKILNLHLQTPLFGYKMQDKRGGQNNIHSWDIGVNGNLTIDERNLMNKIMTERRRKHWADKKTLFGWMVCLLHLKK